jgi:hypothetical protein
MCTPPPRSTLRPTAKAASETGTGQDGAGQPTAAAHAGTGTTPAWQSNSGNKAVVGAGGRVSNP